MGNAWFETVAEAQRREDALLALRGATGRQLAWLASAHATIAGVLACHPSSPCNLSVRTGQQKL